MDVKGWKYYNHAAIPITPPHEKPDMTPIIDGSIWKMGGCPLLARWTTDFDCGYETEWWWIIKESPYEVDELTSTSKKHIKQALKKCYVRIINPEEYKDELWNVYDSAYARYENTSNSLSENAFKSGLKLTDGYDYWAGFECESNLLIGYMLCVEYKDYVATQTAKYNPSYMNKRVSDAIHHSVLQYYLNEKGKRYVCSGERSIYHMTNAQDYKVATFSFRKAYCKLNLLYKKPMGLVVNILMPFRKILYKFSSIGVISKINGILHMEEICRSQKRPRKE